MLDTIVIDQIKVDSIIGVYDFERVKKQKIYIDVEMQYDAHKACLTDNIIHALDYHKITNDICTFVQESEFQLIETLANELAKNILENSLIKQLKLRISKPQALSNAKNVSFRIIRQN